jgi:hypothetical protein
MFDADIGSFSRLGAFNCGCHNPAAARIAALYAVHDATAGPMATESGQSQPAGDAQSGGSARPLPSSHASATPHLGASVRPWAFVNVRIFDGVSDQLLTGMRVVVEGRLIKEVEPQSLPLPEGCQIIDGKNGVLMPGLIDAHWHSILARPSMMTAMTADFNYVHTLAVVEAEATLMRGFTTIRDMGGPRRRADAWSAHIPLRRVPKPDVRPRRLPNALRLAQVYQFRVDLCRESWRNGDRRWRGSSAVARARTADARRIAVEIHGRWGGVCRRTMGLTSPRDRWRS